MVNGPVTSRIHIPQTSYEVLSLNGGMLLMCNSSEQEI
jgi:hypothetical protein